MKEITQIIIFVLLVASTSTLTLKVSVSAELPPEMPVVYVDPQNAFAAIGTTFNVSVKIFNLTNSFYGSDEEWQSGDPLPSPGSRYNYTLGNMYGFNITFSWDPEILEYTSYSVHTPVEDYPDGILYAPIWEVKEEINSTAGTFSIAQNSGLFVEGFNCPNKSATVFTMTFRVEKEGICSLRLKSVKLTPDPVLVGLNDIRGTIPHQVIDGVFTSVEIPRITKVDVGALVGIQLVTPLILGEDATVRILLTNEGTSTDPYNLTLYFDATPVKIWLDENLAANAKKTYNYTLKAENLEIGLHILVAKAAILHNKTEVVDSLTANFTVINTPVLSISNSPNDVYENDTVTFSAEASFHQDPNSRIVEYTWLFYRPGATSPTYEHNGVTVTHTFVENGTWRIVLVVRDNWGITYDPQRSATASYLQEVSLKVHSGVKPPPDNFRYEQIAILVIILITIAAISILTYMLRKKHQQIF
jgi:hypothetical protein